MSRIIIGPNARFSYAYVLSPNMRNLKPGEDPKYQVDIIVDKRDVATLGLLYQAYNECLASIASDPRFSTIGPQHRSFKHCLKDGDEFKPNDHTYAGQIFFTAKNKYKPEVVGPAKEPLSSDSQFYAGCYGNVSIEFKPYCPSKEVPGSGYGVRVVLGNIQKVRDGERLSGTAPVAAADEFAQVGPPSSGAPAPQQPPAQAPAWGAPAPQQQPAQAPATPQPAWPPAQAPHPYPAQAQPAAPVNPHQPQAPWPPTQAPAGQPAWGGPQTFPQ